jgi:energy-coupling factor transporter ATP-binding protein EcfA2
VFASLSVEENLIVAEQQRDIAHPWTLERVYDLFPQLLPRHKQRAGTLSGGEQQMLVIGRALMGNPDVLLLDEPSEGLAPLIVAEVSRGIAKLNSEGLSIILVEQNFELAMGLADDIVVLNTGEVAFAGAGFGGVDEGHRDLADDGAGEWGEQHRPGVGPVGGRVPREVAEHLVDEGHGGGKLVWCRVVGHCSVRCASMPVVEACGVVVAVFGGEGAVGAQHG